MAEPEVEETREEKVKRLKAIAHPAPGTPQTVSDRERWEAQCELDGILHGRDLNE